MALKIPRVILALTLLFLYAPIFILIISSFNESRFGSSFDTFSLKWYYRLFNENGVWEAFFNSIWIGFTASLTATVLGSLGAFALFKYKTTLRSLLKALTITPLLLPDIFIGISLLTFFFILGVSLNLTSVFLAHVTFCLCYTVLLILGRLSHFDMSIVEAAEDLGAPFFLILRKIIFPLLFPALVSAFLLSFTLSFDDYIITSFVLGAGATTLPIYIFGMIKYGSTPIISALSTLILLISFLFALTALFLNKEEDF